MSLETVARAVVVATASSGADGFVSGASAMGASPCDPVSGWATMAAEELEPFGRWRHAEEKPCNRISMLRVCADVGACGLRRVVVGQRVVCVCYGIDRIRQLERG